MRPVSASSLTCRRNRLIGKRIYPKLHRTRPLLNKRFNTRRAEFLMTFLRCFLIAATLLPILAECRAESPADKYLFPGGDDMYIGVDYYPEHWPEERWETDLKMMHD